MDARFASKFSTLSAKSRAALRQPPVATPPVSSSSPAPDRTTFPTPAAPSSGISVDEAWEVFGISKKRATQEQVRSIYLKLVAKYHPDKNPNNQAAATQAMVKINAAFAALKRHCKW